MSIRDRLEQLIFLEKPSVIICEWIPFDPNIFEEISEQLEAKEREKGILLTDEIDNYPERAVFEKPPVVSTISVVNYEFNRKLVLEAFLGYPEVVKQVEKVGITITDYGFISSGLVVEKVDGEENVSLDKLSRIIFDVVDDTSRLMSGILSLYQRRILNIIYPRYKESGFERRKFIIVQSSSAQVAGVGEVSPKDAEIILNEPYINEVKQIIGSVISYHHDNNVLVINGVNGIFIIGDPPGDYRIHAALRSMHIFLEDLTNYLWMIWENLSEARRVLSKGTVGEVKDIRGKLTQLLSDLTLLKTSLEAMEYSIGRIEEESGLVSDGLLGSLEHSKMMVAVKNRIKSVRNLFESLEREIDGILSMISMRIEESLDKLNTITFWLSIIFGAFGTAQLVAAIAPLFMGIVESTVITFLSVIIPVIGGLLFVKKWVRE